MSLERHRKRMSGVGGECIAQISLHSVPRIGGGKFAKRPVTTHPFPASLIRTNSQATGKNDDSRFLSYEEKSIIVRTVK